MGMRDAGESEAITTTVEQLTRHLLRETHSEVRSVLKSTVSHLAASPRYSAAGILQDNPQPGQLASTYWSGPDHFRPVLQTFVSEHGDEIRQRLQAGRPIQITRDDLVAEPVSFIGVPIDDTRRPSGLIVLLAPREASSMELAQLTIAARFVEMTLRQVRGQSANQEHDADQSPVNLIALVAHELRTPLTGVRGNTQLAMMAMDKGDYAKVQPRLEAAINSVDSMTALVQNLLDVSRLERGIYQLHSVPADVRRSLGSAIARASDTTALNQRGITLVGSDPLVIQHDPKSLEMAFFYLLQTVARYTASEAEVTVELTEASGAAEICIRYPGNTLSTDDQRRLFEPFDFAARQTARQHSDYLGLELALSRGIIVHHGGEIELSAPSGEQQILVRLPAESPVQPT
jgi:signal transduction histidine kinase